MDERRAQEIAKAIWGSKGYARVLRRFLGTEKANENGFVVPEGEPFFWDVGYIRRGKRGGRLYTIKGRSSTGFEEAFQRAEAEMQREKLGPKISSVLKNLSENQ